MKGLRSTLAALFALILVACSNAAEQPAATSTPETSSAGPSPTGVATQTKPPLQPPATTAPATTETASSPVASSMAEPIPSPTLFDVAWDDRSIFQSGLIDEEAPSLDIDPGASVYHMDLTISPDLLSVNGRQEVRYTNQEDVTLEQIYFHLFPNLLGGRVTVSNVTVNGAPLRPALSASDTVLEVALPEPLEPGQQVVVAMDFQVDVPTEGGSNYGVFATVDDVLALAHFYPQIAVYDEKGWNIEIPPENADPTYGDASYYLARVSLPAEQVVVASGVQIDRQTSGNEQTLTLAAGPARDFYLASSDRYTVLSQTVGETTVNSYGFSEFAESNQAVLDFAVAALDSLGGRIGPYPYTEFDVAPTPNLALGVEYPGLAVVNSRVYDPEAVFGETPSGAYLESTVAHEAGHQWFYNAVGNDQINDPWLDESLTQYLTYLYFVDVYGEAEAALFEQSFYSRWDRVEREDIPIGLPAGDYEDAEYSGIVYGRGPLFFEALANQMGQETFSAFLRDFYEQNKWGIATGKELKALAEAHCACDLSPLFAEWVGEP